VEPHQADGASSTTQAPSEALAGCGLMKNVRTVLAKHKAYKRARRLWQEYLEVSDLRDRVEADKRLSSFLTNFKQAYAELASGSSDETPDSIFGECTEILQSLLEVFESKLSAGGDFSPAATNLADLFNNALEVAEILIRDEKYRQVVKDTPAIMSQIVDILSIAGNPEAKKIVLRMISSFGSSESKMLIGRHGGFRKMLKLLVEGDEDLTREVLKTLKHFLNVEVRQVGDGSSDDAAAALGVVGGFAVHSRQRVLHAVSGISQAAYGEVNRMFPGNKLERRLQTVAAGMADIASDEASVQDSMAILLDCAEAGLFPPSHESLQRIYDMCEEQAQTAAELPHDDDDDGAAEQDGEDQPPLLDGTEDEMVKELMRMQGVLSTLTNSISEAARSVQLDMMETISRLLLNNPRNQQEFRSANGYFRFLQLLDRVTDYSVAENQVFLLDVFDTVFTIALDGSSEREIGNADAMKLLLDLACTSSQPEVRANAVRTLQDLLTVNYANAAVLHSLSGDVAITKLLLEQRAGGDAATSSEAQHMSSELVQAFVQLLEYMIFLLSSHNLQPLGQLITSVAEVQSSGVQLTATVEQELLSTVSNLVCDLRARKAPICVQQLVHAVLGMLRCSSSPSGHEQFNCLSNESRSILLLEMFGVIVHGSAALAPIVEEAQGFALLTSIVCDVPVESLSEAIGRESGVQTVGGHLKGEGPIRRKDTRMAVRHLALWIIRDIAIACCNAGVNQTKWLVTLLGVPLPEELHCFVFRAVREVGLTPVARQCLRTAGALDALVDIMRGSSLSLVEPALMTLEVLLRDCEENKLYVTEDLLCGEYAFIVQRLRCSGIAVTAQHFRVALELACIGPVHTVLCAGPARDVVVDEIREQDGSTDGELDSDDERIRSDTVHSHLGMTPGHSGEDSHSLGPTVPLPASNAAGTGEHADGLDMDHDTSWPMAPTEGCPWHNAIARHVQLIECPQFRFLHGPPALSRNYAFLMALQKRRELSSDDDDHSQSPRSQSEHREPDGQSQMSDSASETSSLRDSVDLAARDLALQTLLHESRAASAKVKAERDDARQPKWWDLVRRRDRADDAELDAAAVPMGVKVSVDRHEGDVIATQLAGGQLGQQIITNMLRFDTGRSNSQGVPFWRPGSGWAINDVRPTPAIHSGGKKLIPKVVVRGSKALSLLLDFVLLGDAQSQGVMIAVLLRLAASGLATRRSLCHAGGLQRFLELSLHTRFSKSVSVQRLVHVLAAAVGRYDVTMPEARELFLMTYAARCPQQQIRLLQVIAAISQRWEPVALAQLSGPVPALSMPQLEKFPKPHTGYTISVWLKLRATLEPGENLVFCWKDSKYLIFELFFRVWPREVLDDGTEEPAPRRNLCARMRNSPCTHTEYFTFDEFTFDSVDAWYHVVLTHNKQLLNLFVDGHFVQSFQPLNYPIRVSKTYPLRGIIGCPQESQPDDHTAFMDRCTGTFCGELGLFHLTEGVWDAASVEAAAKSFPYERSLQASGITHRQLVCVDPLAFPSVPATCDVRSQELGRTGAADEDERPSSATDSDRTTSELTRSAGLESWRELQRERTRAKERAIEMWRDAKAIVSSGDSTLDPFTRTRPDAAAVARRAGYISGADAPSIAEAPEIRASTTMSPSRTHSGSVDESEQTTTPPSGIAQAAQTALASFTDAISGLVSDSTTTSADAQQVEEILSSTLPLGIQGDVDVHHMRSIHHVAHELGGFFLPLPFLMMGAPQRALGLRILLEMLYASDDHVKSFREARAGKVVLHLLQGWTFTPADRSSDPAYDALFEMLREQSLPAEECMRLIVDLLLIDNIPLQNNACHLQALSDMLLGASGCGQLERERLHQDGAVAVRRWKERGSGMTAMIELLSRSPVDLTRLLLGIVKLMWEPTFSTDDLEMMLEFCVGTVEGKLLSALDDSDTDEEEEDDPHAPEPEHDTEGPLGEGGESRRGQEVRSKSQFIIARPPLRTHVEGCDAPPFFSSSAADVVDASQLTIEAPAVVGVSVPSEAIPARPDCDEAGVVSGTEGGIVGEEHVYGYDFEEEFPLHSAEIDASIAHGLGIADCDFHDHVAQDDDVEPPVGDPPIEVDYATQISEAKVETLIFLRELLVAKAPETAVELLRGAGGFQVLFALLSSPDERSRLLSLDLLGLLLCHGKPADAKAFAMAGGFDTVGKYLVRQWVSRPVGLALLCLAVRTPHSSIVDTHQWLDGQSKLTERAPRGVGSSPSSVRSDGSDEGEAPLVANFEALYCLLQLLHFGTTDGPVARNMAERVTEIVTEPHNLDQLVAHNFIDWSFGFFAKIQRHATTRRGALHRSQITQVIRQIFSAWLLLQIARPLAAKALKQLRKVIADAADFGIHLVEDVVAYFQDNPVLPSEDASPILKNLASIFELIEEMSDISVAVCLKIVALINNMAVRNDPTARNLMKTYKLLDTRGTRAHGYIPLVLVLSASFCSPPDTLVLHCLKCNSSLEVRYELVAIPFEAVIDKPSFHDKLGPLFLLRHMLQTHSDPSLQVRWP
jgi:hypothetical protein